MDQTLDEQATLRGYLLRALDEAGQEQVEERLLSDREFGRRVAMAQDDLFDDYVAGKLSGDELESFREHVLTTPAHLHKLSFARALDRYVTGHEPQASAGRAERALAFFRVSPLRASLALALSLVIVGAALLAVFRLAGLGPWGGSDLRAEFSRINVAQGGDSPPLRELQRSTADTAALTLRENFVREDAVGRRAEVGGGVKHLRLLLEVTPGPYVSYRALLQNAGGEELASAVGLKAREESGARFVLVNVPATFLKRGAYQLRLVGVGTDGSATNLNLYPFEITTR